jgi:hypothetical protein
MKLTANLARDGMAPLPSTEILDEFYFVGPGIAFDDIQRLDLGLGSSDFLGS